MSTEPCRLLSLPLELRRMIYDAIDIVSCRHVVQKSDMPEYKRFNTTIDSTQSITLVRKSLSVVLLAPCHQIQDEASEFLGRKLRKLEKEPVQFIVGYVGAMMLTDRPGPLYGCFGNNNSSSNPHVRAFNRSCSTFLAHTRTIPRDVDNQDHIEIIAVVEHDPSGAVRYGYEVIDATRGASVLAVRTGLAVKFTYRKADAQTSASQWGMSSGFAEHIMRLLISIYEQGDVVKVNFRFKAVETDEEWEGLMKAE
jgi:hypothetical protein